MQNTQDKTVINGIRTHARHIVRELGFMQSGLAGTNLSPSAVHTILELGYGTVSNASALGQLLHLEKSSVSRLLKKLQADQLIHVDSDEGDKRSRKLSLTQDGETLLNSIEVYAQGQLQTALGDLAKDEVRKIEVGLARFAKALGTSPAVPATPVEDLEIRTDYQPGIIAQVTGLHAAFYSKNYGFGSVFERKVATEMAAFMGRIERPMNTTFSAYRGDVLLGSVSIDGQDLEPGESHLRWFIVSPAAHGAGIGRILMQHATAFVDKRGAERTRLWTFKGLDAARHIYEKNGFQLVSETPGTQWGTQVTEQEFMRTRPL